MRLRRKAPSKSLWQLKQELAWPGRYYGNGGTIHASGYVDVEVDKHGNVVSVWFRCQMLPFKATKVLDDRAHEMEMSYREGHIPQVTGIEVLDDA